MPGALWRCMFKLQFFRVRMPAARGWDTASCSPDPAPFVGRDAGDEAVWTAIWHWLRGERLVRAAPGRLSALSVVLVKSGVYGAFCMGVPGAQHPKTAGSGPGVPGGVSGQAARMPL
jgi:hypothetical protein